MMSLSHYFNDQKQRRTCCIFSTVAMLKYDVDFVEQINIKVSIVRFSFIKPLNKKTLVKIFKSHKKILTIEEHLVQGGLAV